VGAHGAPRRLGRRAGGAEYCPSPPPAIEPSLESGEKPIRVAHFPPSLAKRASTYFAKITTLAGILGAHRPSPRDSQKLPSAHSPCNHFQTLSATFSKILWMLDWGTYKSANETMSLRDFCPITCIFVHPDASVGLPGMNYRSRRRHISSQVWQRAWTLETRLRSNPDQFRAYHSTLKHSRNAVIIMANDIVARYQVGLVNSTFSTAGQPL
jgi:hypothetical protein